MKKQIPEIKIALAVVGTCVFLYACYLLSQMHQMPSSREMIPILGFHQVVHDEEKAAYYPYDMWVDSESAFEEKIRYLYEQGYETWTMDELYAWMIGEKEAKEKTVVLTFDDGYYACTQVIVPILKKYGFQATTFVIGSTLEGEHTWDGSQLQFLNKEDMKDQSVMQYYSHTYDLHEKQNNAYAIDVRSKAALVQDMQQQKKITDCSYLAYPYGHYNDTMIEVLKEHGVKLAFGYHENVKAKRGDDVYKIPRFSINAYTTMDTFRSMLESKSTNSR